MTDVVTTKRTLGTELGDRRQQFAAALPAHIPVDRFQRVVLTAIQNNPKLASADRASLWNACIRAAQDGLLPDGREGALTIFSTKAGNQWIDKVAWMPMLAGIRKKVRNCDDIATWDVHAVYERDQFEFELGDEPFIKHRPHLGSERGELIAVYSIALLKTGEKSRDVMSRSEVEYVRDIFSKKDRDGKFSAAWRNSFEEMAKKTIARRHAKMLPMSTDLDEIIRRDNELYDVRGARPEPPKVTTLRERMPLVETFDPDTGEITESETVGEVAPTFSASGAGVTPLASVPEGAAVGEPPNDHAAAPTHSRVTKVVLSSDERNEARAKGRTDLEQARAKLKAMGQDPTLSEGATLSLREKGEAIAKNGRASLDHWIDKWIDKNDRVDLSDDLITHWQAIAMESGK